MKSTITITPVTNIKDYSVIDNSLITTETHDSDMDVFTFLNVKTERKRRSNLMSVSLFNDVIVREDGNYKILHMLSK